MKPKNGKALQIIYYSIAIVIFLVGIGGAIAYAKVGLIKINDHEDRLRQMECVYTDIATIKTELENQGDDIDEIKFDIREIRQNE
jgi:flagellar basal body-associated protein FliL